MICLRSFSRLQSSPDTTSQPTQLLSPRVIEDDAALAFVHRRRRKGNCQARQAYIRHTCISCLRAAASTTIASAISFWNTWYVESLKLMQEVNFIAQDSKGAELKRSLN